jgi:hypothetical protein
VSLTWHEIACRCLWWPCDEKLWPCMKFVSYMLFDFILTMFRTYAHEREFSMWRTETANQRVGDWMGADKNFSKEIEAPTRWTRLPTHVSDSYPSWPRPRSHWSATDPRNQQTILQAKTHQHAQRKRARLAASATPVRPMACTGQTGGQSRSGRWLQQPHNKCSREP